jgi:O-antigen/teichoic acid export membrane protein
VSLFRPALVTVRSDLRVLFKTIFHTNIVSYARLAQSQLPTVILGLFAGPVTVGVYKVGSAAGLSVGKLTNPAGEAVLPRLSKLWVAGRMREMRHLLFVSTAAAATVNVLVGCALVAFRGPVLAALGGTQARAAGTVLIFTVVAVAVDGALFWNSPMLYAAGRPAIAAFFLAAGMVLQVALLFVFVGALKADGAALAMLISYLFFNIGLTIAAVRVFRTASISGADQSPTHGNAEAASNATGQPTHAEIQAS